MVGGWAEPNIVRAWSIGRGKTKSPRVRAWEKKSPLAGASGYLVRVETSIPNSRRAETIKVWAAWTCFGRDSCLALNL